MCKYLFSSGAVWLQLLFAFSLNSQSQITFLGRLACSGRKRFHSALSNALSMDMKSNLQSLSLTLSSPSVLLLQPSRRTALQKGKKEIDIIGVRGLLCAGVCHWRAAGVFLCSQKPMYYFTSKCIFKDCDWQEKHSCWALFSMHCIKYHSGISLCNIC